MDADKMRAEFEKWADSKCMSLTRIGWDNGTISDYAYTATFDAWQVWQAAYAAGRRAEQSELERRERAALERLRAELRAAKLGRTSRKQKDTTPPTT